MCERVVQAERSKMKKIYLYIFVFICKLVIIFEKMTEEIEKRNFIEIIRDRKMGKENWNVIIHLTFSNILNSF